MNSRVAVLPVLACVLFLAGCTTSPAPGVRVASEVPPAAALAAVEVSDAPPGRLSLAGWANFYGYSLVEGAFEDWHAEYPDAGSPVAFFVWEYTVRRLVPAAGVPADSAAAWGLVTSAGFYVDPRDTTRQVRVLAVDEQGRAGKWSGWGYAGGDTLRFAPCEN